MIKRVATAEAAARRERGIRMRCEKAWISDGNDVATRESNGERLRDVTAESQR